MIEAPGKADYHQGPDQSQNQWIFIIRRLPLIAMAVSGSSLLVPVAYGAQCPAPSFVYEPEQFLPTDEPITAEADRVVSEDGVVTLDGNTTLEYQGRVLSAENAEYNPRTGEVAVEGALRFLGQGILLESANAFLDIDDDLFRTGQSDYEIDFNGKRASGTALGMSREANGHFLLEGATYSTCPPGDKSWYVKADSLDLDPDAGIGTARDLRLVFKGVPIIALPVFSFPISDKRKTGFLAPIVARGESTGLELHLPWYWNIRPNLDATFTPRFMSKRGAQLQSEFRYLNRQGAWILDNEYLADRQRNDEERHFTRLFHGGRIGPYVTTSIQAANVSDNDYLEDLGDSFRLASITHLEQRADLVYERDNVSALARFQNFQTVDDAILKADRPHRRLPQLKARVTGPRPMFNVLGEIDGEFVYFDKTDAVTGTRLDLQPRLTLPIERDAWFLKATASQRFTYYALTNSGEELGSSASRNISTFALDGGLYFDRILDEEGSIQTLEPRLYYLRVPYQNQNDLPIFDSSAFDFNISQLFRENRFSGADRVADADQLSMALTTRYIDGDDGSERLRASIGQIMYFDDRRITLPGSIDPSTGLATDDSEDFVETRDFSDLVSELTATIDKDWYVKGGIQWNPDIERTVRSSLLLSYRPDDERIVNIGHRVVNNRPEVTEQIDFSALWPVSDTIKLAGRWNYSLDADRSIESLLGIEYESCCWSLRFAARRFIADNGEDHDTGLYLQLVLKGLAPVGQNYGALLENAILGYRDKTK